MTKFLSNLGMSFTIVVGYNCLITIFALLLRHLCLWVIPAVGMTDAFNSVVNSLERVDIFLDALSFISIVVAATAVMYVFKWWDKKKDNQFYYMMEIWLGLVALFSMYVEPDSSHMHAAAFGAIFGVCEFYRNPKYRTKRG